MLMKDSVKYKLGRNIKIERIRKDKNFLKELILIINLINIFNCKKYYIFLT